MSEFNVEKLILDYLDSVYVISHSQASVDSYRSDIDHFTKSNSYLLLHILDYNNYWIY